MTCHLLMQLGQADQGGNQLVIREDRIALFIITVRSESHRLLREDDTALLPMTTRSHSVAFRPSRWR